MAPPHPLYPKQNNVDDSATPHELLLHQALCLLGLSNLRHPGVNTGRLAFRGPNPKALQLLLYHLHCLAKGKAYVSKALKGCWPIIDKAAEKEFQQRMLDWVRDLAQQGVPGMEAWSPTVAASLLRSASGHRCVAMLADIAHHVLQLEYDKLSGSPGYEGPMAPCPPTNVEEMGCLLQELGPAVLALGSAKSEALARSMLALMQQEAEQQERAAAAAQELQEEFYQLAAQRQQLSLQAGATAAAAADGPGQAATPSDQGGGGGQGSPGSTLAPGDAASLEQAAALWADLQAQLLQVQDLQACAQSVAGCSSHPRPIDGAALAQTDVGALVGGWAAEVHGIAQQLAQLSSGDSVSSHGTIQSAAVVEAAAEGGMVTTGQQQRQAQQPAACQALVLGTDPPGCPPGERHIDHLQMQLALHRSALASLRDAKAALERELEAAQAQAPLLRQQLQRRGLLSPATGAPAPPSAVRPAWTLDGGAGGAAAAAAATAVEALTKTVLRRRMERVMAPATDAAPALPAPAAAVQPPASLADAATEAVAPLSAAKPKRLFLDGAVAFASGDSVGSVDSVDVLPPQLLTGKKKKPVSAITGQLCDTAAVADQPAAAALLSMQQLVQRFQQAKAGAGQ